MARKRPAKERAFYRIFRISRRYAWWVVIASVLITGVAAYYVRNIPIRGSFLDLLPRNDPLIDNYRHTEESLLQSDYLALLVSLDFPDSLSEEERTDRLLTVAQQIKEQLDADPEFVEVAYTRELAPEIPDQYLVLYRLNKDELAQIEASVESAEKAISGSDRTAPRLTTDLATAYRQVNDAFTQAIYGGETTVSDPTGAAAVKAQLNGVASLNTGIIATIDNLDSMSKVTANVQEIKKVFAPSAEQTVRLPEPFFSGDRTKLLINVRPRFASERGVTYSAHVMTRLQAALSQVDLK